MNLAIDDILRSDRIPTLPAVALRVIRIVREPEPDFAELASVIRADPALASRVMRVANSALFGLRQKPSSIEAAVPILGVNLIRTLILGFTLADTRRRHPEAKAEYQRLWRQALNQASIAETLAKLVPGVDPANWFLAGLLQDVGQLAMLDCLQLEYLALLKEESSESELVECERAALGFDHVELTVALLKQWQFEDEIISAVGTHHHNDFESQSLEADNDAGLALALAIASRATLLIRQNRRLTEASWNEVVETFCRFPRVARDELIRLIGEAGERAEECAAAFQIDIGEDSSVVEILVQANQLLGQVAVTSQVRESKAMRALAKAKNAFFSIKRKVQQVQDQAQRDALTGVYNRAQLDSVFGAWLNDCEDAGAASILFMDIDDFKRINDQNGHDAGDQAIRVVAEVLRNSARETDQIFRYGGDEFLLLLHSTTWQQVHHIADRIRRNIANALVEGWPEVRLSTSIGAVHVPTDDEQVDRDSLVLTADQAMYRAKEQGGNHVVMVRSLASSFRKGTDPVPS